MSRNGSHWTTFGRMNLEIVIRSDLEIGIDFDFDFEFYSDFDSKMNGVLDGRPWEGNGVPYPC